MVAAAVLGGGGDLVKPDDLAVVGKYVKLPFDEALRRPADDSRIVDHSGVSLEAGDLVKHIENQRDEHHDAERDDPGLLFVFAAHKITFLPK